MKTFLIIMISILTLNTHFSYASSVSLDPHENLLCRGKNLPTFYASLSAEGFLGARTLKLINWPSSKGTIIAKPLEERLHECTGQFAWTACNGEGIYDVGMTYGGYFKIDLNEMNIRIGSKTHSLVCE